jgi:hypothetical protein
MSHQAVTMWGQEDRLLIAGAAVSAIILIWDYFTEPIDVIVNPPDGTAYFTTTRRQLRMDRKACRS